MVCEHKYMKFTLPIIDDGYTTVHKRPEITYEQLDALRPTTPHFGRRHGLSKTHKKFDTLPTCRPIIDTTNIPNC